jgi:hypothetical protein
VIVGIAVALVVASGPRGVPTPAPITQPVDSSDDTGDETPKATGSGGAVASATSTAAQRRLAEVKGWVDGLPDRYSEIREALTRFPGRFPGAPEVEEAKALLAEADASFAKLADAELEKAVAEAKARALGDKPGDAESVLTELRTRFADTAWFETRGREAMDDADLEIIQLVVSSVEIRAGKLLGRAEAAFEAGDVGAAREILYSKVWSKQLLPRAGELARKIAATEAGDDATAGVTKGLVGWWKFDEADGFVAADSSGGARNAAVNGASWAPRGGRVGGAMRFNGTGGHVRASAGFADFSGGLTIALWARPTAAARYARFVDFANGSPGDNFLLTREGTSSGLLLEVYKGGRSQGKVHARGAIENNAWQHFTATIDADGNATVYRNGEQVASGNLPTPKVVARSLNYIGRSQRGQDEWYEGLMDDLRIYDRALSAEEARALWSGAPAGAVVADAAKEADEPPKRDEAGALAEGLVGWWRFDEGSDRMATDSSGAGNDGTFTGGPRWIEGHEGKALAFDGRGSGVKFRVPADLTLAEVTVSLRVRVPAKGWRAWTDWWELNTPTGVVLGELTGTNANLKRNGAIALYCLKGLRGGAAIECGNHVLPGAGWKHLVYTISASRKEAVVYVDGDEAGRGSWQGTVPVTGFSVGFADRMKRSIVSDIDDVRLYSRALTAEDVLALSLMSGDEALAGATSRGGSAPVAVTDGLVAHWTFDEPSGVATAVDSAGSHGGKISSPDNMPGKLGKIGTAFSFGGNDHVATSMPGLHNTGMTWSAWIKTTQGSGAIMANVNRGWTKGAKCLFVDRGKLKLDAHSVSTLGTNVVVNDGKWHNVALSVGDGNRANKTFRLYVDGVERMKKTNWHFFKFDGRSLKMRIGDCRGKGGGFKGEIDDVRIYNRALTAEEVTIVSKGSDATYKRMLAGGLKLRDLMGTPAKDGFSVGPSMLAGLKKAHDAAKVTAKRLCTVGDNVAASTSFDGSLRRELTLARGYVLSKTSRLVGKGKNAAQIEKSIAAALAREKAEVVRICVGLTDLLKGTDARAYGSSLDAIIEAVSEQGGVPVLYTLPVIEINPSKQDAKRQPVKAAKAFSDRARAFNDSIRRIASRRRVPYVDADAIVNRDDAARAKYFTSRGALKSDAYKAMNARFLRLYRLLEFVVFGRGEAPARATAGGGPAVGGGQVAVVEVANGGFEEKDDCGFAAKWTKAQWGDRRVGSSVRLDKSNPHGGESALVVRALGDGSKPGVSTTLKLDPGTYEASYWACAAVGKSATVGARFGGRELAAQSVTDKWKQFTVTVKVENKNLNAGLGIWTSTPNVRVWFDDVKIRMTKGPEKP